MADQADAPDRALAQPARGLRSEGPAQPVLNGAPTAVPQLPQLPQGSAVARAVAAAKTVQVGPPLPLSREIPEPSPFPFEALGPVLGPAARAIHERVQSPMAMCGTSVLAAAALATQAHANIKLPNISTPRPISLYFVSVAESGERKSGTDREALWTIAEREACLRERFKEEHAHYQNQLDAYRKAREKILRQTKGSTEAMAALDELGAEPLAPCSPCWSATSRPSRGCVG